MALDVLLQHVEAAGRREAEQILDDARRRARAIVGEARERSAVRLRAALAAERRRRRQAADEELAIARRDGRERLLRARRQLLDRVFGAAKERLREADAARESAADGTGANAGLPDRVMARAAECLPPGRGAVLLSARQAGGRGSQLATDDGVIRVDLSAVARLDGLRPELEIELLRHAGAA